MTDTFEPFDLTLRISSKEQLVALWLLANSDTNLEIACSSYMTRTGYLKGSKIQSPFGMAAFMELDKALKQLLKTGELISETDLS